MRLWQCDASTIHALIIRIISSNVSMTRIMLIEYDSNLMNIQFNMINTSMTRIMPIEHDSNPTNIQSNMINTSMIWIMPIEHDLELSNAWINIIIIETINNNHFDEIMTKWQLKKYMTHVKMIYKWKDKKIRSMNISLSSKINLEREVNLKSNGNYDSSMF